MSFIPRLLPPRHELAIGTLSRAEREIVAQVLVGFSNAEIARTRNRSERTIANQISSIFRKLEVRSRRELLAKTQAVSDEPDSLSARERQIIARVRQGLPNKLIADELGLAIGTVAVFVAKARRKTPQRLQLNKITIDDPNRRA